VARAVLAPAATHLPGHPPTYRPTKKLVSPRIVGQNGRG